MLLLHDVRLRLIQSRRADQGGRHTPGLRPVTDLCGDDVGRGVGEGGWPGWRLHRDGGGVSVHGPRDGPVRPGQLQRGSHPRENEKPA